MTQEFLTDTYQPVRIGIVGTGNVGATFAYALLQSGLAGEIVLIDRNHTRAEGEAMDLNHAVPLATSTRIWAGGFEDLVGSAVTVVTAGTSQKPDESRLDLVHRNYEILQAIIPEVVKANPGGNECSPQQAAGYRLQIFPLLKQFKLPVIMYDFTHTSILLFFAASCGEMPSFDYKNIHLNVV